MSVLLLLPASGGPPPTPPPASLATAAAIAPRPPDRFPVIAAAPVTLRHIVQGQTGTTVVGATYAPHPGRGINGRRGYQSGTYEPVLNDEGTGRITLPNTVGEDGVLHRRRFACLTDPAYHPGDEWIEIRQDGQVLFIGTPTDWEKTRSTVTLELVDALWMLNTQRDTAAGFWAHAPRDVFEHYTKAWLPIVADDFDQGADFTRWSTSNATNQAGSVRLAPGTPLSTASLAATTAWLGIICASERAWRLEATYDRALQGNGQVTLQMSSDIDAATIELSVGADGTVITIRESTGAAAEFETSRPTFETTKKGASLAIECRDRWVLFYVDGQLAFSCEFGLDLAAPGAVYRPEVIVANAAAAGSTADVMSILLRKVTPALMRGSDRGDYRLPGIQPSGGLRGTYYDEADLRPFASSSAHVLRRALAPTRQPYARRQDATINFPSTGAPSTWQPATPPNGEWFSTRWSGAIYLDLAANDVSLRLRDVNGRARAWIGKTMYGQELLSYWTALPGAPQTVTGASLRTHLATSAAGWYPIRIEHAHGVGFAGLVFERSVGGAAWEVVPASVLSPFGIYEAQVRYDSHAEQLKAIALAYGLQYRVEPRSLESGEFPGTVVPRVRVGRDTDKVLTPDQSTDAAVRGSASEVVDTIFADASGLGDQANAAQLTSEAINYAGVTPGQHMMIASAYESLADITDPVLLQTRLASMLGLRLTAWEEVSARPRGHQELRDSLPMTGALALFAWEPGDGIRAQDEALDLSDETARQIIAPSWPFGPDGRGAPSVRFRQRPRSQQDALRALVRAVLLPQRNYQGQLTIVNGTYSHLDGGVSRVALPRDLDDIIRCELVVSEKTDASTWTIQHYPSATSTGVTFTSTGRFDLRAFVNRFGGTSPQMTVTAAGGTGAAFFQLELVVRV